MNYYTGLMDGWHGDEFLECMGSCHNCDVCSEKEYQDSEYDPWDEEDFFL